MTLQQRIDCLTQLGQYLREENEDPVLTAVIHRSEIENPWFTPQNVRSALQAIATEMLDADALRDWAAAYSLPDQNASIKTIGIVMAGNLPLVGFHDWLCVFISGHHARVKLSDKDKQLLPFLLKKLAEFDFEAWGTTHFLAENEPLRQYDAVIATGSNNTARYFEQYFSKAPHIIRRNRNSVAVLDGAESMAQLYALGHDVLSYFGLGCRNVSKIYVPRGYNFEPMLEALHEYRQLALHNKYKNNFDYNMTLFILNQTPFLNNGSVILKEDTSLSSRIASLHYEYYDSETQLIDELSRHSEQIQCIVGRRPLGRLTVMDFGQTQHPGLRDYPDGVDVMDFLREQTLVPAV